MAEKRVGMRVIEQSADAVDLSRSDTDEIVMRVGHRSRDIAREIHLDATEARVLAYSLLAAAIRADSGSKAEWPREYWAEGSYPGP